MPLKWDQGGVGYYPRAKYLSAYLYIIKWKGKYFLRYYDQATHYGDTDNTVSFDTIEEAQQAWEEIIFGTEES